MEKTPENTVPDELWNAYPARTETQIRQVPALFRFTGGDVFKATPRNSDGAITKSIFSSDDTKILACSRATGKDFCEGSRKKTRASAPIADCAVLPIIKETA